ncbi:MAG: GlsB/YeaQ/YmgE family stress response membrane protein [Acidimicrobiales bacterium]
MEIVRLVVSLAVSGILFGALGRLAIPGPNPMSLLATILAGLAGAFLGTLVAGLVGADLADDLLIYFALQVAGAAVVVYGLSRRSARVR